LVRDRPRGADVELRDRPRAWPSGRERGRDIPPWRAGGAGPALRRRRPDGLPADYYEGLLRGIVAFELPVTRLDGKFKLGQNRSVEDRRRTIAALEQEQSLEAKMLAEFMRTRAGV